MEGLTEGRIVHYVLPTGEHRPAIVVKVWRITNPESGEVVTPLNGCSNLQVFTDSDSGLMCNLQVFTDSDSGLMCNDKLPSMMWKTSVTFDDSNRPGSWHWIEKA